MVRSGRTKRPSIHDVARRAGVSAATVSKVMQGVATVRAKNVLRVQKAVEELGRCIDRPPRTLHGADARIRRAAARRIDHFRRRVIPLGREMV